MKSSLKDQPQPDGISKYCNKSFHLVNHGSESARNIDSVLKNLNRTGPMLGTKMFSSRRRRKSPKKKRKFGGPPAPFLQGKLSTSVGTEGLPLGAKSPQSIYDTFPNIFKQGSPLPRPYDPIDNLRMQSLYEIHGFGHRGSKRKSKRRKCSECGKKHSCRKSPPGPGRKRSKIRHFGATPGTPQWTQESMVRNKASNVMNKYSQANKLALAKGWTQPSSLFVGNYNNGIPNVIGMINEPAQSSNNQLNSPVLFKFGAKRGPGEPGGGKKKKGKSKPSLTPRRSRKFGPLVPNVAGPNTVGYQASIPIYHGGANTIDFLTNKLYRPDIVGPISKVQPDGMTPRAWLTQNSGKYRFGSGVYTPNGVTYGTGHNTIMQPLPPYMNKNFKFGGNVITLNSAGQVQITRPPKTK